MWPLYEEIAELKPRKTLKPTIGTVAGYDKTKGIGYITANETQELCFVSKYWLRLPKKYCSLKQGQSVIFDKT